MAGSEGTFVFVSGLRMTAREEPDRVVLHSIKNASRQVFQLSATTADALKASKFLPTINQKAPLQITDRMPAVI